MVLMDHFASNAGTDRAAGENGFPRLPANGFSTMLAVLVNEGGTQADARAEMIRLFGLETADEPQLDEILTIAFSGTATSPAKQREYRNFRDAFVAFEGGFIDKARAESNAGVTRSGTVTPSPL